MELLRRKAWSPYKVGAAIGVLETIAMLTAKKPLGITTVFEHTAAMAAEKIAPGAMGIEEYKAQSGSEPKVGWETGLVAGVVLGSLYSARLSGDRRPPAVPETWRREIGPSKPLRYAAAAAGGALMMFGARMAKGCTSGHGISGTMQFSASSWLFDPIMFAAGAAVSKALFGRKP
jgi:uncharacterized protein